MFAIAKRARIHAAAASVPLAAAGALLLTPSEAIWKSQPALRA